MTDWVWLLIGGGIGTIVFLICDFVRVWVRDRKTWFVPIGTDGGERVYQCRKCGGKFTCAVIERMFYCPVCGREVDND